MVNYLLVPLRIIYPISIVDAIILHTQLSSPIPKISKSREVGAAPSNQMVSCRLDRGTHDDAHHAIPRLFPPRQGGRWTLDAVHVRGYLGRNPSNLLRFPLIAPDFSCIRWPHRFRRVRMRISAE